MKKCLNLFCFIILLFASFFLFHCNFSLDSILATFSQNDDHMFEILRTEMTQLAIASELTRSHYLLIPYLNTVSHIHNGNTHTHHFSHMFAEFIRQDITARTVWFFIPMSFFSLFFYNSFMCVPFLPLVRLPYLHLYFSISNSMQFQRRFISIFN